MKACLLDTSALLALYRNEPGVDRVLPLFSDTGIVMLLSAVSIAEFARRLRDLGLSREDAEKTLELYLPLFSGIVPVDEAVARASLRLRESVSSRLPMVDSLIAASALTHGASLVHKDRHMASIPPEVLSTLNLADP
ncbi:MAG: PIN domain-containing protein [Nitrospirae bacterium]|nr:PIN domain-containing protein [Nitrospirota bacterium]